MDMTWSCRMNQPSIRKEKFAPRMWLACPSCNFVCTKIAQTFTAENARRTSISDRDALAPVRHAWRCVRRHQEHCYAVCTRYYRYTTCPLAARRAAVDIVTGIGVQSSAMLARARGGVSHGLARQACVSERER